MKQEIKRTKDGTEMTTQDGTVMMKYTFEVNDVFVPLWNLPITEQKGMAKFPRYVLKVKTKAPLTTEDGKTFTTDFECERFVDLTPSQYNSLVKVAEKLKENDDSIVQHNFIAYEYESEDFGSGHIGVRIKGKKYTPASLEE